MQRRLLVIFFFLISVAQAQQVIRLTHYSGRERFFNPGERVAILSKTFGNFTGVIVNITPEMISIGKHDVLIDQIDAMGRKTRGSNFVKIASFVSGGICLFMAGGLSTAESPTVEGENAPYVFAGVGTGLMALGILTSIRNHPKDVRADWKIDVIERPGSKQKTERIPK